MRPTIGPGAHGGASVRELQQILIEMGFVIASVEASDIFFGDRVASVVLCRIDDTITG